MRLSLLLLLPILLTSCTEQPQPPKQTQTTAAQFRIALRTEPYKPGGALTSGEFVELNVHTFPVPIGDGPKELVSSSDGVVLLVKWQEAAIRKRSDPPQPYLMLRGFSYRLCNRLVSPYGSSWWWNDWSDPMDVGLDGSWDHFLTPIAINSGDSRSPVLVLQWRWTEREQFRPKDFLLSPEHKALSQQTEPTDG